MASSQSIPIGLGITGLTLLASFVNTGGTLHATLRNLACTENGTSGTYRFSSSSIEDDYRGQVIFHTGTGTALADFTTANTYGIADINPELADIKVKTDLITTGGFTVVSPVNADGTSIEIYRGDDYLNADGRALSFTVSGIPSMVGGSVLLKIKGKDDITGTVVNATVCRFDMSRTISAELTGSNVFDFEVEVTLASGSKCTPGVGTITASGQL